MVTNPLNLLSGFFFAFAVVRYGVSRWRETYLNTPDSDVRIGAWWDWAIRLVLVEAVVLMVWWLYQARSDDLAETWTLFSPYNVGTVVIQFVVVLAILIALNGWLARKVGQTGASS